MEYILFYIAKNYKWLTGDGEVTKIKVWELSEFSQFQEAPE